MDLGLADRVVWVAGSSRGIGYAIARSFLTESSRVVISGRAIGDLSRAEQVLSSEFDPGRVMTFGGDLSVPEIIDEGLHAIHQRWGDVHCLVSAVGSGAGPKGWHMTEADWSSMFTNNFVASRRLAEAVLPGMIRRGSGNIVLISSIVGVESVTAPVGYSAAKAALIAYGKNLAREVGPAGVRVNSIAPGNVLFPGGSWERRLIENPDECRAYIDTEVPLRRFGSADEIAAIATFLASDRASFVTGACAVVDGGQTRRF